MQWNGKRSLEKREGEKKKKKGEWVTEEGRKREAMEWEEETKERGNIRKKEVNRGEAIRDTTEKNESNRDNGQKIERMERRDEWFKK